MVNGYLTLRRTGSPRRKPLDGLKETMRSNGNPGINIGHVLITRDTYRMSVSDVSDPDSLRRQYPGFQFISYEQ